MYHKYSCRLVIEIKLHGTCHYTSFHIGLRHVQKFTVHGAQLRTYSVAVSSNVTTKIYRVWKSGKVKWKSDKVA